jgi:hypothetical protein
MYNKHVKSKDIYKGFQKFRANLQTFSCYVTEYPQGEIDNNIYTFVISLPEEHSNLKMNFVEGKYSHMYSKNTIERIIPKTGIDPSKGIEVLTKAYQVLTKNSTYLVSFVNQLNKDFGTKVTIEDISPDAEYDYRPQLHQEVLNYDAKRDPYKKLENE